MSDREIDEKIAQAAREGKLGKPGCNHGVTFDPVAAKALLAEWRGPKSDVEFIMGNPMSAEIRKRWPRLFGKCPLGCGYEGIYYASREHYAAGDW
jgi:hypothetical protein